MGLDSAEQLLAADARRWTRIEQLGKTPKTSLLESGLAGTSAGPTKPAGDKIACPTGVAVRISRKMMLLSRRMEL
jgi:hypothetical protein